MATTRTASREVEGRDSVGMYLDEIARTPLLDAITEVELSKTIEAGLLAERLLAEGRVGRRKGGAPKYATAEELEWLASEGQKAIQRFIEANLRLVVSIARKYGRSQMPMLDLVQEGNTGLIRAVEKFDYAKGYKFSTYATWWVRQAITRGIAQQARVVRLPVHVVDLLGWGRDHVSLDMSVDDDGDTTLGDLVARSEDPIMPEERVLELLEHSRDLVSLDQTVGADEESRLGDFIEDADAAVAEDAVAFQMMKGDVRTVLSTLEDRERDVVVLRFGLDGGQPRTLEQIGKQFGLSRERVRQIERETMAKLRDPQRADALRDYLG